MDKYDRQAAEIVFKHFGAKADMSLAAVVAAALREYAAEAFEEAAKEVPSNWLDPILTGPGSVYTKDCPTTERLLKRVSERIAARAASLRSTTRGKGA